MSYSFKNLVCFPSSDELIQFSSLSFDHNPIDSFQTLPQLPRLVKLTLDGTNINSFDKAEVQPNLEEISFFNTPLSKYKNCNIMAFIVFGDSLRVVNNIPLSKSEIAFGREIRSVVGELLKEGWIIKNISPVILVNPKTGEKKQPKCEPMNGERRRLSDKDINIYKEPEINKVELEKPKGIRLMDIGSSFNDTISSLATEPMSKDKVNFSEPSRPMSFNSLDFDIGDIQISKPVQKDHMDHEIKLETIEDYDYDLVNRRRDQCLNSLKVHNNSDEITINGTDEIELTMNTVEPDIAYNKRKPPPKLTYRPVHDINDCYSDSGKKLTEEQIYELFFCNHLNEITTPKQAKEFVEKYLKDQAENHPS